MIALSIVTMNRCEILRRTLDAMLATTTDDDVQILVTDNASSDGTPEMLREYEAEGKIRAWLLKENLGTSGGRNAHWAECIGHDAVRIDDKVLPLYPGWLTSLKLIAEREHAIVAVPYDPTVLGLWQLAPIVPAMTWSHEQGVGGPLIFIPGEVTEALGGVDELCPEIKYGWDDVLQIERAKLLGWKFAFSLRSPVQFLAQADPTRRNSAMDYHGLFMQRLQEYREAERDLFIPIEETRGYQAGREAMLCSV